MATDQRQYRALRILRTWDQPGYRDQDLVIQNIVDEIRRLETTKLTLLSHWSVTEDTNGDLLVEGITGPTVRLRLTAAGLLSISGDVAVAGDETVQGAAVISGAATIAGTASISGDTSVGGALTASGATTLKSTLEASGAATLDSTLLVKGTAEVSGAATFDAAATVKGNLAVSGTATISGAATVSGTTTLAGDFAHTGTHIGEFGHAVAARPAAYTVTNATPIRSIDVATATLTQLANLVAQIIQDFQGRGTFQ